MIKIEYSLIVSKPSADVLSYQEYVIQFGDAQKKADLEHLLALDQQLYDLYPTLKQTTTGLEVNKEYICFDEIDAYYQFEQEVTRIYDSRAKAAFKEGLAYCTTNNIYVNRFVREIDENGQVYGQTDGFTDD
jgi:hypothetical protein